MFERTPLDQLLTFNPSAEELANAPKQLSLHGF